MDVLLDLVIDGVVDSIKLIPFLFLVYLLINYLESSTDQSLYNKLTGTKYVGPIVGSLLGALPQCGFSVMGANLYSKKLISMGTLLAIFISTSDEAVPILFANPGMLHIVVMVLMTKVMIGLIVGLCLDFITRNEIKTVQKVTMEHRGQCTSGCCGGHEENIWLNTLNHTFKVFAYILVINLVLNGIIEWIGEDTLSQVLLQNSIWQPALAGLIGLIPNCAASIILTEMFVVGNISLGSLIAGLCTGAGIGLVVLFKANANLKENLKILGLLYVIGTAFGMLIQMIL